MHFSEQDVIDYYHTPGSRLGYKLLLGGKKHFGYYVEGAGYISIARALSNMEDQLAKALDLPEDSLVLDAGCGEGGVSIHLAETYKLRLEGIDLLDFNIESARKKAAAHRVNERATFRVGSYMDLPFSDSYFDGAFTMETLVHAVDHGAALGEIGRVLKPHGKLVLFEYTMPARIDLTSKERRVLDTVNQYTAMQSFSSFTHGSFPSILDESGFVCESVTDISDRVLPMLRHFARLAWAPYSLAKLFHRERLAANSMAGYEFYKHRNLLRYNIIVASKK